MRKHKMFVVAVMVLFVFTACTKTSYEDKEMCEDTAPYWCVTLVEHEHLDSRGDWDYGPLNESVCANKRGVSTGDRWVWEYCYVQEVRENDTYS